MVDRIAVQFHDLMISKVSCLNYFESEQLTVFYLHLNDNILKLNSPTYIHSTCVLSLSQFLLTLILATEDLSSIYTCQKILIYYKKTTKYR